MNIQPIETVYKGYRFRSRLEARWAVFFDALGIRWEYEKEGYDLGDGLRYLPDFWLPEQQCWVEIKGVYPPGEESTKAFRLGELTQHKVYVFVGEIGGHESLEWGLETFPDGYRQWPDWDNGQRWCECPTCKLLGITFTGWADRLSCGHLVHERTNSSPRIHAAFDAARQARFEHGEQPRIS